jgi:UDP-N-acetylmuramate: L-alanyl-gamma-D-glutamyl-meso-diaminopimelate ligase
MNHDYPMNTAAVEKAFTPVVTYGSNGNPDYLIKNIAHKDDHYHFTLRHASREIDFTMYVAGRYNAWNLTAGIILGLHLGIPGETIREAVKTFKGVERRLNKINQIGNTLFLEDFAHHPTAIKNVLQSVKEIYPQKKRIVFFEPRSWSLRRNFFQDLLGGSFIDADEIFFREVYEQEKIPVEQRLDVSKIEKELKAAGKSVIVFKEIQVAMNFLQSLDYRQEQVVIILSNGSFDGLPNFVRALKI